MLSSAQPDIYQHLGWKLEFKVYQWPKNGCKSVNASYATGTSSNLPKILTIPVNPLSTSSTCTCSFYNVVQLTKRCQSYFCNFNLWNCYRNIILMWPKDNWITAHRYVTCAEYQRSLQSKKQSKRGFISSREIIILVFLIRPSTAGLDQ